jgi:hypothetical protein
MLHTINDAALTTTNQADSKSKRQPIIPHVTNDCVFKPTAKHPIQNFQNRKTNKEHIKIKKTN